ncbi:MAG: alkaline phosphatase [Vicinamibacterales bacterium]
MTRREFMLATAMGAALASAMRCARKTPAVERRDLYPQGVASGDPTADSVILWTRRPPRGDEQARRLTVEIAADPAFSHVVAGGVADIHADADWTCRFLATGLEANREYWFRFIDDLGFSSRIGRTLTAPADEADTPVRFTFVSCQSPNESALNAYRRMIFEDEARLAHERLHFVLHLGDFIYEVTWYAEDSEGGMNRGRRIKNLYKFPHGEKVGSFHLPVTLEDYRTLYRAYLEDPDLQDARARWPFVCVWDNHEFAWAGFQSQYVAPGVNRPSQSKKVIANQAWWEYIPARVKKPGGTALDRYEAPAVADVPIERFDEDGLGDEPNNLIAINSLKINRVLRWGRNVDLFLTDHHSFRSAPVDSAEFGVPDFRWAAPQVPNEILDYGRACNGSHPPATIRFNGRDFPNPAKDAHFQTFLGREQRAWFLEQLDASRARWKIWGHSFGTMDLRSDYQNLPGALGEKWPRDAGYALFNSGFYREKDEIFDFVRDKGISGFAIVAGDRHAFYAGLVARSLPPREFSPIGVEFITGSLSQQALVEVAEQVIPKDDPLRALYLCDRPDGSVLPAMNVAALHGVRSALVLQETGDMERARAVRNPEVSPHLSFLDQGGHGYAMVTATADQLDVEFVCIPRPLERSERSDGGPLAYRVVHRTRMWKPGETPRLEQEVLDGDPRYSI